MVDLTPLLILEVLDWEQQRFILKLKNLIEIKESIVVGQSWDNDIRIILFISFKSKDYKSK